MSAVEHPVTYHAVVRYMERVRGIDLTGRYPGATDRSRVQQAAAAHGVTVDALRAMAVSPRMQAALRLGGDGEIRVGRVRMPVVDGRVITCIAMPPKVTRRRSKSRETVE